MFYFKACRKKKKKFTRNVILSADVLHAELKALCSRYRPLLCYGKVCSSVAWKIICISAGKNTKWKCLCRCAMHRAHSAATSTLPRKLQNSLCREIGGGSLSSLLGLPPPLEERTASRNTCPESSQGWETEGDNERMWIWRSLSRETPRSKSAPSINCHQENLEQEVSSLTAPELNGCEAKTLSGWGVLFQQSRLSTLQRGKPSLSVFIFQQQRDQSRNFWCKSRPERAFVC